MPDNTVADNIAAGSTAGHTGVVRIAVAAAGAVRTAGVVRTAAAAAVHTAGAERTVWVYRKRGIP